MTDLGTVALRVLRTATHENTCQLRKLFVGASWCPYPCHPVSPTPSFPVSLHLSYLKQRKKANNL